MHRERGSSCTKRKATKLLCAALKGGSGRGEGRRATREACAGPGAVGRGGGVRRDVPADKVYDRGPQRETRGGAVSAQAPAATLGANRIARAPALRARAPTHGQGRAAPHMAAPHGRPPWPDPARVGLARGGGAGDPPIPTPPPRAAPRPRARCIGGGRSGPVDCDRRSVVHCVAHRARVATAAMGFFQENLIPPAAWEVQASAATGVSFSSLRYGVAFLLYVVVNLIFRFISGRNGKQATGAPRSHPGASGAKGVDRKSVV